MARAAKVHITMSGYVPVALPDEFDLDLWESGDDSQRDTLKDAIDWREAVNVMNIEYEDIFTVEEADNGNHHRTD